MIGCKGAGRHLRAGALAVWFAAASFPGSAALAAEPPPMNVAGQFGVSPAGAATYAIPIVVPPGTAGLAPALSLNYSSQSGNGILGFGWSLGGLPSIARCPRTAAQDGVHGSVNYDGNDRFCLDGQRLLVVNGGAYGGNGSEYRTEIESFSRVVAHGPQNGPPDWFEVHTKSGQILELGNSADSRIPTLPVAGGAVTTRVWAVSRISDTAGNYLTVSYATVAGTGQYFPDRIAYTGNAGAAVAPFNSVTFSYIDRNDATPLYHAGAVTRTTKLLSHIRTYANPAGSGTAVTDYQLDYQLGNAPYYQLTGVRRCDGSGNCLAPATFGWQEAANWPSRMIVDSTPDLPTQYDLINWSASDFNGDGIEDGIGMPAPGSSAVCEPFYLGTGDGWIPANMTQSYLGQSPQPACIWQSTFAGATDGHLIDVDGDGLTDVTMSSAAPACFCILRNDGQGNFVQIGPDNSLSVGDPSHADVDIGGDGRADAWGYSTVTGILSMYAGNGDGTFANGVATHIGGEGDSTERMTAIGDVDGDGCADFHLTGTSLNEIVMSPACAPPVAAITVPQFSEEYPNTAQWGDFNGDGNRDYFTVANGGGALHLSTGTSFLTTVLPSFTPGGPSYATQYFVGDFDGDGKNDVLQYALNVQHIEQSTLTVYTWTSGTLAPALTMNIVLPQPECNDKCTDRRLDGQMRLGDVDGDGCTDLVVQQGGPKPLWYMKFGCRPPLLMTSVSNGLGAVTRVAYDRLNRNQPLYTKCPSAPASYQCGDQYPTQSVDGPIYVVTEVDTSNGIGGTF
ncbi:MAG: VCBS repeat-containing protein, partial [Alphaproteobacteria bacterium]|nr:VCBS repeat-containing protein [Alphaproteobacteria bacterium]